MWGFFRKRSNSQAENDRGQADNAAPTQDTEEIYRNQNLELDEGVGVGEDPSRWLDQVKETRASNPSSASSPFAPTRTDDTAAEEAETPEPARRSTVKPATKPITSIPAQPLDASQFAQESHKEAMAPPVSTASSESTTGSEPEAGEKHASPQPLGESLTEAQNRWRAELESLGGHATQRTFRGRRGTYIDLSTAHPSGIAPLLSRRPVKLSSLLREPLAFRNALDSAMLVAQKGIELEASRGLNTVKLAIGFASWTSNNGEVNAPIFLRAAALRRVGRDYEVQLTGALAPNAALLRALYEDGVTLRASELMALAGPDATLFPEDAFDRLRELGSILPGFDIDSRALVATFAEVSEAMLADAEQLNHAVLDALAGHPGARDQLGAAMHTETSVNPDRRDPSSDRLLLDADTEQERVVDTILGGSNFVVEALPGTGVTQTVVNAIGQLVDRGRRVLVVSPRSASTRAIRARLKQTGLDGLAVSPRTLRRDLIAGITRNERAERPNTADLDDALVRLRHVLADYRSALSRPTPEFGVSPLDVLEALSRLELLDIPPSTTARLEREVLIRLANKSDREAIAERLRELGELGQFRFGPEDSPWYAVQFGSTEDVSQVHGAAVALADGRTRETIDQGLKIVTQTNLRMPETYAELGVYLRLLADIRETLDRFKPEVFDAELAELIDATSPRRDPNSTIPNARRRELRNLAREYVRPGTPIADLHESLKYVQRQRILWHRYVQDAAQPNVPIGIEQARTQWREISALMRTVDDALTDVGEVALADTPLEELDERLDGFAAESEVLDNAVERLQLSEQLHADGLGGLLDDLAERHLEAEVVGDELELAWWQSVLEEQLTTEKALLNANTRVLTRLEADFRVVDEAHTESSAQQLAWQLAQAWKVALVDESDGAQALRELLRNSGVSATRLVNRAGPIASTLAQVWIATPYDVPRIDDRIRFDTVLLVDAAAFSTAEAVGAIRRAKQVVAFGDPVTQFPSPFTVGVKPMLDQKRELHSVDAAELARLEADSAYARLAEFLPTISLTRSYRAGGEDLAELVNERFYGGRMQSMPWAGAFLGHSSLTYSYVEGGTGLPDQDSGAVEATDAEVTRVVELVVDHALRRTRESLMVVSASAAHVQRVEQAVWSAVSKRADVTDFFTRPRNEPFVVTTIEGAAAQSRDRVIFSLGYGITPHGRVLSEFGILGTPLGEKALAIAMTRARRSLVIVTCVRADQMDINRMSAGAIGLAQILTELAERTERPGASAPLDEQRTPMLVDLARRLGSFGMHVALDYRGRVPLAASYGNRAIAIDLEGRVTTAGRVTTLRESLRLRPELLKRLGWYYLRVHAFELFANPESVARRIAVALEVPMPEEREPIAGEITDGTDADTVQSQGELTALSSSVPRRPNQFDAEDSAAEEFSDPVAALDEVSASEATTQPQDAGGHGDEDDSIELSETAISNPRNATSAQTPE
ncbi:DEAD/DEAH box helicase [Gulosibacter chungangensis]|uniref:AAA family ATPase n=1 Tax=Gulosibacter chungangensis TaxID=979746 RepID=A0A7J5BAL4_9MICO|nr:ATP-binding protein [Gulosibacter chungangensis]KAB1643132.1 AAA family ATPase [Gulosibacter chungangensis]